MPEFDSGAHSALVLLVEDERALRKVMELVLQGEGYDVMTANNGREALALLAQSRPNLIISDFVMPEMDGGELVRCIRADARLCDIPILLMSSAFPADLPEKDLVNQCLEKGGPLDELLDTIAALLVQS